MNTERKYRSKNALGLLTKNYTKLLVQAKNEALLVDLTAQYLDVPKRRLYDINNVLEGIGLVEKKGRKSVQWKGAGPGCNSQEVDEKLTDLKDEIRQLEEHEQMLDSLIDFAIEDCKTIDWTRAYLTCENIESTHKDDTTYFVISTPNEMNMEFRNWPSWEQDKLPALEKMISAEFPYYIFLRSPKDPIDIYVKDEIFEAEEKQAVNGADENSKRPADRLNDEPANKKNKKREQQNERLHENAEAVMSEVEEEEDKTEFFDAGGNFIVKEESQTVGLRDDSFGFNSDSKEAHKDNNDDSTSQSDYFL